MRRLRAFALVISASAALALACAIPAAAGSTPAPAYSSPGGIPSRTADAGVRVYNHSACGSNWVKVHISYRGRFIDFHATEILASMKTRRSA